MASLNSQFLKRPNFSFTNSPSRPSFPFPNRFIRNPIKPHGFLVKIPCSRSHLVTISSRLGRPSKRRNSLRKKLNDQQKVQNFDPFDSNSNFHNPIYTSNGLERFDLNLNSRTEEGSSSNSVEKSELLGESVLWNKLESWVDQYKEDIEFWGIGSGPVFTIFKDFDGNVKRVLVNEDEILRRSQIEPGLFKLEEMGENFMEAKLKISHANHLAREMETGQYELPNNSSIAKFVVPSQQSEFLDSVRSVHISMLSKHWRIGFVMVCSCLVFWSVKKIFVGGNGGHNLSREKKEMLRRKMKAREKEKLKMGGMEVLPKVANASTERPQINKEELMSSILKVKAIGGGLTLQDSSSSLDANSRDFSRKIQEIKEMARQVRELEQKGGEKHEDLNEEASNEMEDVKTNGELNVNDLGDLCVGATMKPMGTDVSLDDSTKRDSECLLEGVSVDAKAVQEQIVVEKQEHVSVEASSEMEEELRQKIGIHHPNDLSDRVLVKSTVIDESLEPSSVQDLMLIDTGSLLEGTSIDASSSMARQVQELKPIGGEKHGDAKEDIHNDIEHADVKGGLCVNSLNDLPDGNMVKINDLNATLEPQSFDNPRMIDTGSLLESAHVDTLENNDSQTPSFSSIEGSKSMLRSTMDTNRTGNSNLNFIGSKGEVASNDESNHSNRSVNSPKPRVIRSVKEAKEYLALKKKRNELKREPKITSLRRSEDVLAPHAEEEKNDKSSHLMNNEEEVHKSSVSDESLETTSVKNAYGNSSIEEMGPYMQEEIHSVEARINESYYSNISSNNLKSQVTQSLNEGREHLSQNHELEEINEKTRLTNLRENDDLLVPVVDEKRKGRHMTSKEKRGHGSSVDDKILKTKSLLNASKKSTPKKMGLDGEVLQAIPLKVDDSKDMENEYTDVNHSGEAVPPISGETWIEKNFQEFEPIARKIGDGFRGNYMVAKERSEEQLNVSSELNQLLTDADDSELEWMKDDSLSKIVFKVRENELMGRDPFHMMDAKDKNAFFEGLEKKVEKENSKLLNLHEWVHSRIENLDYGADGISLYDLPEKVIPRWKGPPLDKDPDFLNNRMRRQDEAVAENSELSLPVKVDSRDTLQKLSESRSRNGMSTTSADHSSRTTLPKAAFKNNKTVIESSDGSKRVGKKSGKEYWQHTKKWSRDFLEAYNAETDPEVKSLMKDMGKDLDRWITHNEIEEVADLMNKIPKKRRRSIEKKLGKLKKEMQVFGPQAVASKYREYADDKEEDYLWWLDLPFILCIELYTAEDGIQEVGFYSLEMAADLELDPKQYHVIAFEDPGDSKSFCYIMQAHMEQLAIGRAFVVARPPKDVFREAKSNSFSVTVIRKGELRLNVDQTLEEVEEQITEIGSKMYHDKIMRERSMDIGSVVKGVFGDSKPAKRRRSKRILKKPTKQ